MKASIIIVSYNSEDFIEKCISSVIKNTNNDTEIVVLDNASTDQTFKILEKFVPQIKLLKSEINLGFGQGMNKAIDSALGEYLFLLNPDTEVHQSFIDRVVAFYQSDENIGLVGVKTILPDGEIQKTVKKEPTLFGAFAEFILGVKNSYSEYVPKGDKPKEVEVIYGAAVLIKRDLFKNVGGFSDKYFMYYEDVDLCRKIRKAGKKIYYYPQVAIVHLVGATKSSFDKSRLNYQSSVIYHGGFGAFILRLIFLYPRIKRKIFKAG